MDEGESKRVMVVYRFPKGKYLEEIVFRGDAGRWRVYEIALK
jgi:hypothetical protein